MHNCLNCNEKLYNFSHIEKRNISYFYCKQCDIKYLFKASFFILIKKTNNYVIKYFSELQSYSIVDTNTNNLSRLKYKDHSLMFKPIDYTIRLLKTFQ